LENVEILTLPRLRFAHVYKAGQFRNFFPASPDFIEVSYVAEGGMEITEGGRVYQIQKGDVLCALHQSPLTVNAPAFHCHHTVGITADWTAVREGSYGLRLPTVTRAEDGTEPICRLIDGFINRQAHYRASGTRSAAKILELLCQIDHCSRHASGFQLPGEQLYAQRARELIQQRIHQPLTQREIAAQLGISPGYLCSVFKKAEGVTLMQYINRLKLEGIRSLMENENAHLYEAAALYGYTDPNYVSRLYRQLFGYNITDRPNIHPELP